MPKYEWHSIYELSVPEIDGDHRVMLDLVNMLDLAIQRGNKEQCEKYVSRLLEFSRMHFSREEQLLESWGYQETGTHRQYHAGMYEQSRENFERLKTLPEIEEFEQLCDEALAYLIDDVIRGDMTLKSYLIEKGIAAPGHRDRENPGF